MPYIIDCCFSSPRLLQKVEGDAGQTASVARASAFANGGLFYAIFTNFAVLMICH